MKLKLLFTFLLLIVLQTIALGQSCNVVKGEDFMEYGSGFIIVKFALSESKCPFTEI
nr:hypothetical protein [uncultured Flavobacterium sp.]